jgi:hypothetical protein
MTQILWLSARPSAPVTALRFGSSFMRFLFDRSTAARVQRLRENADRSGAVSIFRQNFICIFDPFESHRAVLSGGSAAFEPAKV